MRDITYKIFGFWIRREACRMAATAMQNHRAEDELCPRAWSLTVFFESYMVYGSDWTMEGFGPKEPVDLKAVDTHEHASGQ